MNITEIKLNIIAFFETKVEGSNKLVRVSKVGLMALNNLLKAYECQIKCTDRELHALEVLVRDLSNTNTKIEAISYDKLKELVEYVLEHNLFITNKKEEIVRLENIENFTELNLKEQAINLIRHLLGTTKSRYY